ncbi:hypothetical protein CVT26_004661 [Gymnopilus dilepis]|uniref:F-box domain-containing protein n=1 Tax=Gymnopilus dilepis TaxID=231916 RepID=A0A409YJD5_9AGAR|nr:hypothetical protein CVT26_004661 [Gymnopilus dilepis]
MPLSAVEILLLRLPEPVVFRIFHACDLLSLLAISRTSKMLRGLYAVYRQAVWDPDDHYKRWFHDVDYFKSLLRKCGAVVSGSFALQFFGRFFYPSSDMDIFLRVAGADDLCYWLCDEGYSYEDSSSDYGGLDGSSSLHFSKAVLNKSSFHDPLLGVYAFQKSRKHHNGREEVLRVQIVVVDTEPIHHVLFDFHSIAAVINFLTADEGFSVFPWSTFVERISYVCKIRRESADRVLAWTKKYEDRGFSVRGTDFSPGPTLVRGCRFVGDRHTWRMSFKEPVVPQEGYYGPQDTRVRFEVLLAEIGEMEEGSCVRIAEPYIWRSVASPPLFVNAYLT